MRVSRYPHPPIPDHKAVRVPIPPLADPSPREIALAAPSAAGHSPGVEATGAGAARRGASSTPATQGRLLALPPLQAVARLAAPTTLVMLVAALSNVLYTWYVSRLGPDAIAAVSLVFPLSLVAITAMNSGIGGGSASAISRALGAGDASIMFRHVLPNAMVATLSMMPFILSGSMVQLSSLDFLGFGLPPGLPSLGEMITQGKNNLQAPWLGISAFVVIAAMLSLLVFVGEAVRDAFDPRKTFR